MAISIHNTRQVVFHSVLTYKSSLLKALQFDTHFGLIKALEPCAAQYKFYRFQMPLKEEVSTSLILWSTHMIKCGGEMPPTIAFGDSKLISVAVSANFHSGGPDWPH